MKFLVTGSAGLIGSQVVLDLEKKGHTVYSGYHDNMPEHGIQTNLDITKKDSVKDTIQKLQPDIVIHLAAMTNVDLCETKSQEAMRINADATKIIAEQTAKISSFFLYVSTDYVFDGENGMKKESDVPNPLGMYGKSKYYGELELNTLASPYAIARTSTPFGFHKTKKSFPVWVKENLESNREIPILIDQYTSPTFVPNLSQMLIEIATKQYVGIIHTAGATRITRYAFAELIADKLGLDKKLLRPTSMNEMNWKSPRPKDSSLNVSWAAELLQAKPQTVQHSLDIFFSDV